MKPKNIKFTRHAHHRCHQRDIDPHTVEDVAAAAVTLLNENQPIRIRHRGHTIVATKKGGQVKIISTWKHLPSAKRSRK